MVLSTTPKVKVIGLILIVSPAHPAGNSADDSLPQGKKACPDYILLAMVSKSRIDLVVTTTK